MNIQKKSGTGFIKDKNLNYSINLVENKKALPLHIQSLEKALNLNSFLKQVHSLIDDKRDEKINLTISKQQSKDIKTSMYSFSNIGKNKNWLKSVLIGESDSEESDEDIGQSVQELLKIRKYKNKITQKQWSSKQKKNYNLNLSSNVLSLNESIPLNSFFKNDKTKSQSKKLKPKKKKIKLEEENPTINNDPFNCQINELIVKVKEKVPSISNSIDIKKKEVDSLIKKDINENGINSLNENNSLDCKLLDDLKYEPTMPDEILQTDFNMNCFVKSFLSNMNDQIVYSNQLPDEIFETEEEVFNGIINDTKINDKIEIKNEPITTEILNENKIEIKKEESVKLDNCVEVNLNEKIKNDTSIDKNKFIKIEKKIEPIDKVPKTSLISLKTNELVLTNQNKTAKVLKKKDKFYKSSSDNETEQILNKRKKLWATIAKKDVPKIYKQRLGNKKDVLSNCKKLALNCLKERKNIIGVPKLNKERSKKSNKEIATYWKSYKRNSNIESKQQSTNKLNDPIIINENIENKSSNLVMLE